MKTRTIINFKSRNKLNIIQQTYLKITTAYGSKEQK